MSRGPIPPKDLQRVLARQMDGIERALGMRGRSLNPDQTTISAALNAIFIFRANVQRIIATHLGLSPDSLSLRFDYHSIRTINKEVYDRLVFELIKDESGYELLDIDGWSIFLRGPYQGIPVLISRPKDGEPHLMVVKEAAHIFWIDRVAFHVEEGWPLVAEATRAEDGIARLDQSELLAQLKRELNLQVGLKNIKSIELRETPLV